MDWSTIGAAIGAASTGVSVLAYMFRLEGRMVKHEATDALQFASIQLHLSDLKIEMNRTGDKLDHNTEKIDRIIEKLIPQAK